ncbi:FadR/GntR family transcriptional regulator [Dictyobacter formicarum]|uniref:GntR C-terminal domain-containing protein n=1 Tax=Dictyobacter formicarum TaxID=2778368 RepID=A0ABQ3VHF7_9CHLR|nr:FCD domain-containing protein [Dictyobacter formicarum]GHO85134.1 hypothetical protein KSZ_31400 [Dictyobacter formicarum]
MDSALHDAARYIAADNEFHRILAKATHNPLLLLLIDSIVDLLSEQRKRIFTVEDGPSHGQVYHKQLIEAIADHDTERALQCMQAHLRQVREDAEKAQRLQQEDSTLLS